MIHGLQNFPSTLSFLYRENHEKIYTRLQSGRYCSSLSFNFWRVTGFGTKESIPFAKHSSALSANAFAVICNQKHNNSLAKSITL